MISFGIEPPSAYGLMEQVQCNIDFSDIDFNYDRGMRLVLESVERERFSPWHCIPSKRLNYKALPHNVWDKPKSNIERVIFNDPATIIYWKDGTKTVVKCQEGDTYSKETGFVMCYLKKLLGNDNTFNKEITKWVNE